MWKPPERIKYTAVEDDWPDQTQAGASLLFSPLQLGPLSLEQRTWVPAMVPWRSNEAGEVTEDVLQWYERFARGKPGVIVVEATGIRDVPSGPLLRIGDDRYLPGLTRLADTLRKASGGKTRLLIQLIDFRASAGARNPGNFSTAFCRSPRRIARLSSLRMRPRQPCANVCASSSLRPCKRCSVPRNGRTCSTATGSG